MSGVEVVTAELTAAARALGQAAAEVAAAGPADLLPGVADALPGSESAAAAERLARAWRTRFLGWDADAHAQRDALLASAEEYDASDRASQARIDAMRHRLGGPR